MFDMTKVIFCSITGLTPEEMKKFEIARSDIQYLLPQYEVVIYCSPYKFYSIKIKDYNKHLKKYGISPDIEISSPLEAWHFKNGLEMGMEVQCAS